MMETLLTVVVSLLVGVVIGFLASSWHHRKNNGGVQAKAAEEKLQDYRQEVEQHFAKTADLIDHLTDSYKDVFSHLSESAEHLLTEEQIKNQLLNRKAREVTLKYLKGDEAKDPSDPPNLTG